MYIFMIFQCFWRNCPWLRRFRKNLFKNICFISVAASIKVKLKISENRKSMIETCYFKGVLIKIFLRKTLLASYCIRGLHFVFYKKCNFIKSAWTRPTKNWKKYIENIIFRGKHFGKQYWNIKNPFKIEYNLKTKKNIKKYKSLKPL